MKKLDYQNVVSNIPIFAAKFRINRVPDWAKYVADPPQVGWFLYVRNSTTIIVDNTGKTHGQVSIPVSCLSFVEYIELDLEVFCWIL